MNIIYVLTMYRVTLSKEEAASDIKKAVINKSQQWESIDKIEIARICNARISFEGRRSSAKLDIVDDEVDVTFFVLSEEQKNKFGESTRIEVLDIALPAPVRRQD